MSGRPICALIDLAAIAANWREIKKRAPRRAFAVIKADAYGHGALRVAAALDRVMDAADGFALTEIAAARALRRRGVTRPILLLNGFFSPAEAALAARENLWFALHSAWQIAALAHLPADARATVFVKCDTGMNRLGFSAAAALGAVESLRMMPQVGAVAAMTHFAAGDDSRAARVQLRRFAPLRGAGIALSLANSALLFFHPQPDDEWARIGVALYGASPAPQKATASDLNLRPAMTLTTRLIAIRNLRKGDRVGYGGEFAADAPMRVGIAAAGYGDGYPRAAWRAGGAAFATLETRAGAAQARLVGRVSMDLLGLDLSAAPAAAVGDPVILWGASPAVDEVAAAARTIGYELLTRAAARRQYR